MKIRDGRAEATRRSLLCDAASCSDSLKDEKRMSQHTHLIHDISSHEVEASRLTVLAN